MLQAQRGQMQLTLTNIIAGHQRKGQVEEKSEIDGRGRQA